MAAGEDWLERFPALGRLEPEAARQLRAAAVPMAFPAGAALFSAGSACHHYLMVLDGAIRVEMVSEGGREIVLYRVGAGETCILTTACLMTRADYSAHGVAETAVRAVSLPADRFRGLLAQSDVFREFVFSSYGTRIADLLVLIEEVAFRRVDVRLARLLTERAGPDAAVTMTHGEIAAELGTAREVVSRQLKEFERRGWVSLGRGRIMVQNAAALRDAAAADGR
jgi:CRP/FNR family transcriptional regulator